ncbi:MAG: lactate dehydrogenase [Methanomicrobiales archaeon]|nr:lactate dehydrogenase [Methanomicrobiales archaeon]
MVRLAVVGVGRIGGEVAYLASALGIVDELVLYDSVPDLLQAQVLDLRHTGLDIGISTKKAAIKEADVCLFSAGIPRNVAVKTRADLLSANLPAANDCVGMLRDFSGVLITVTNPMDVNNYYLHKKTGIPKERCIGFGGQLDSTRFGLALRDRNIAGVPYVLGEHGEHQVPVFSRLKEAVAGPVRDEILAELRGASMAVIQGKGGTVYGPAFHMTHLIRMILTDAQKTTTCSCILDGEYGLCDCSLGVPVKIGREGILSIEEWELDAWEKQQMDEAGSFVRALSKQAVS